MSICMGRPSGRRLMDIQRDKMRFRIMEQLDRLNAQLDGTESRFSQPSCRRRAGAQGETSKSNNNAENRENQFENQQENPPQIYDLRAVCVQKACQNPNLDQPKKNFERVHHITKKVRMEVPDFD